MSKGKSFIRKSEQIKKKRIKKYIIKVYVQVYDKVYGIFMNHILFFEVTENDDVFESTFNLLKENGYEPIRILMTLSSKKDYEKYKKKAEGY